MSGSLYQRGDGYWCASVQQHGKRRTVYGKTEADARRKLSALNREAVLAGGISVSGVKTLDDLLSRWIETVRPTLKPKTAADYVHVCERYVSPKLGMLRLSQLTPEHLQKVYSDLQRQRLKRVPAQVHAVLHRALRMAVLWRWLSENPADRVMRPTYRAPRKAIWTKEQLSLFLTCSQRHKFGSVWLLALATGCRLGELLALRWTDVQLDSDKVTIRRTLARINREWIESSPKTQAGERTITIPSEAIAALRHQRAIQAEWRLQAGAAWVGDDRVFSNRSGGPVQACEVEHAITEVCDVAGLPRVTPHGLRHLHASLLLGRGLPLTAVSARLGHASPQITMAIYAHALNEHDAEAAEMIGSMVAQR